MKRAAVVVMVMALLGGCFGSRSRTATTAIGGTMAVVGFGSLAIAGIMALGAAIPCTAPTCPSDSAEQKAETKADAKTLALVGVALAVPGIVITGLGLSDAHAEQQARVQRAQVEWSHRADAAARDRERAWTATKAAGVAARSGDCLGIEDASRRVHALDAEFHRSVFMTDVAITWCLGVPIAKPLPPPPPPRDRIKDREKAFALTKQASKAARDGKCADALALEPQVRELDTNVHEAWFVRDDAIKPCLQRAAPSATP